MKKAREWPAELRKPMTLRDLAPIASNLGKEITPQYDDLVRKNYVTECARRFGVMLEFFGVNKSDEIGLLKWLIVRLCNHWNIPAFQVVDRPARSSAKQKIWTDEKSCQLFADVMALVPRLSENAACVYIAKNSTKYRKRYDNLNAKTLHRQFLYAKSQIVHDPVFRLMFFSAGGPFEKIKVPEYGRDLIAMAVERYAITRQSEPNKLA